MLKNNLKDISNIVLLRSDKILYELLNSNSYSINNKSDSYHYGMQDFYPSSFRKGTIENSMNHTMDNSHHSFTLEYNFDFLDKLFDEYIKIDGTHIYAKQEILDKYSSVISKIHPFNIIGYRLATQYNKNRITIKNIREFTKYITPLALSTNRDYKEYADNHIHLGGANDTALNFLALLSQPTLKEFYTQKMFLSLPRINEFSYINNGNISFGQLIDIAKYCVSVINSTALKKDMKDRDISKDIKLLLDYGKNSMVELDFASFEMVEKFHKQGMQIKDSLLNETIQHKKDGYANRQWFVYNILLFSLHENSSDRPLKKVIKIFLHITNILRSYMVMSQNLGLSHFSEYFDSKFRKQEDKKHNNIASNIIANGTTKVEAKISPSAVLGKDKEFIKYKLAFDKEIIKKESNDITQVHQKYFLDTKKSKRNYHFSIHFVRQDEKEKKSDFGYKQPRFFSLRNKLKVEVKKLSSYLYNESHIVNKFDFYREFYDDKIKVLQNESHLKNQYIELSKLITSIDVAGDENRTPPEVFAPVLKYLRRDIKKQDDFMSDYIKYQRDGHDFMEHHKLRISVHAGEDFNHIVTGMRKVHESVKFYQMDERDRLGHALAIGINPKEWCELNGDIFVTKQEYIDNLVWLYHQSIKVLPYCDYASKLMKQYEKQIKELCEEIYSDSYGLDDLYKAWKLREYCPVEMFSKDDFKQADEYIQSITFDFEKKCGYEEAEKIYKMYHTSTDVRKKGDEVIKIEYTNLDNNMYPYRITDEDLDLIEAVQDRLIQKFCDKGIIIETNPSSNVYIAHIHSYDNHPIFRWNPVNDKDLFGIYENKAKFNRFGIRTSRMKVCVNTDDPAIMPTTLRNEFELIERIAFKNHSDNLEEIKEWSEKIRELGVKIFDYDHKVCEFVRV